MYQGIARKLVKTAMQEAAKKREMRYSDLKKIDRGVRRHFHDDITAIVIFFDLHTITTAAWSRPTVSLRGGGVPIPSNTLAPFSVPAELNNTYWNHNGGKGGQDPKSEEKERKKSSNYNEL
jgi:pyruvate dehydrogenase phosphatase